MSTQLQTAANMEVKGRIMELQSALFFTDSTSLIKLPTHVISEVEVDAEGMIWFVIPRPSQDIRAFEKEMPARMEFFKKGKDFFIKISGTASLIAEGLEDVGVRGLSSSMVEKITDKNLIAVRVEMNEAGMVDNSQKTNRNWLQVSRSQLSSWFF